MSVHTRSRIAPRLAAAALVLVVPTAASALKLEARGDGTRVESSGSARVELPVAEKITTTPAIPPASGGGVGFGGSTTTAPLTGSASIVVNNSYTAVADPLDPPTAALCYTYSLDLTRTITVTTGNVSVAFGTGGEAGYSSDFSTMPVQMTLTSPVHVFITRSGGGNEDVINLPPVVEFLTATAPITSQQYTGSFSLRAGDVLHYDMRTAVAGRTAVPATLNSFRSMVFSPVAVSCGPIAPAAPVPTLSPPLTVLLALLTLGLALFTIAVRRRETG